MPNPTDPRPLLTAALDQLDRQVAAFGPGELSRPTPCDDFDVAKLLAHLTAVLRKLTLVRGGGDMTTVPDPAIDVAGHEADALRRARIDFEAAWLPADDAELAADYTLAWGTMTGTELLDAYTHEFTAHAWDLAQAHGNAPDLDPALAEAALDWFGSNVSPDGRGEGGPFGSPIPVADEADAYTRLAGYLGRTSTG